MSQASAHNLIGLGGNGGLIDGVNGNLVGVANTGLADKLANNGGPTQTIALLKGSPAINAGSNTLAVDLVTGLPLATDQRGDSYPRIVNNSIDIGSFEYGSSPSGSPPAADAGGPYTVDEGGTLNLNASGSSDPDGNPLTYYWDINGDGSFGDASGLAPTLSWSQLESLGIRSGPATFDVRVRVDDGHGHAVISPAKTLKVLNVAPIATFTVSGSPILGAAVTASLTGASDPSSADATAGFHYAFSTDPIAISTATYANSGTAPSAGFTFDAPGTHTLYARIIDQGDGFNQYSTTFTVLPISVTADAGGPYTTHEGDSLTLDASASSSSKGASPSYFWDINGDGVFTDATGVDPTLTWDQLKALGINDGPATFDVRVRVDDGLGHSATSLPVELKILNAPPTATLSLDLPAFVGVPVEVRFSGATDPSTIDAAAGFHYAFATDPSALATATYANSRPSSSANFTFSTTGIQQIYGRVFTQDNAYSEYSTQFVVSPLGSILVVNNHDSGPGSLRDAISLASDGDQIVFDSILQGQTITLTTGELVIDKSVDIEGLGALDLTVSGGGASQVFDIVNDSATVTIAHLSIADGSAQQGGGIYNSGHLASDGCRPLQEHGSIGWLVWKRLLWRRRLQRGRRDDHRIHALREFRLRGRIE